MHNPRAEIVRLIAANKQDFQPEQVQALFVVTAEDLVKGGVDHIRVEAAMMLAWVSMQLAYRDAVSVAELLRDFADRVERPSLKHPGQCGQGGELH